MGVAPSPAGRAGLRLAVKEKNIYTETFYVTHPFKIGDPEPIYYIYSYV